MCQFQTLFANISSVTEWHLCARSVQRDPRLKKPPKHIRTNFRSNSFTDSPGPRALLLRVAASAWTTR